MTENSVTATRPSASLRQLVLSYGPLLTLAFVAVLALRGTVSGSDLTVLAVASSALWSPLPISIPAVLLDHERDTAPVSSFGPLRAVVLMPWLMFSSRSAVRTLSRLSVGSWMVLTTGLYLLAR